MTNITSEHILSTYYDTSKIKIQGAMNDPMELLTFLLSNEALLDKLSNGVCSFYYLEQCFNQYNQGVRVNKGYKSLRESYNELQVLNRTSKLKSNSLECIIAEIKLVTNRIGVKFDILKGINLFHFNLLIKYTAFYSLLEGTEKSNLAKEFCNIWKDFYGYFATMNSQISRWIVTHDLEIDNSLLYAEMNCTAQSSESDDFDAKDCFSDLLEESDFDEEYEEEFEEEGSDESDFEKEAFLSDTKMYDFEDDIDDFEPVSGYDFDDSAYTQPKSFEDVFYIEDLSEFDDEDGDDSI